jgi:hypothetical protein
LRCGIGLAGHEIAPSRDQQYIVKCDAFGGNFLVQIHTFPPLTGSKGLMNGAVYSKSALQSKKIRLDKEMMP